MAVIRWTDLLVEVAYKTARRLAFETPTIHRRVG